MREFFLFLLVLIAIGCGNKQHEVEASDKFKGVEILGENQKYLNNQEYIDELGNVKFVSFDIQTTVGIHKYQIENNQYGNTLCKISKLKFDQLLLPVPPNEKDKFYSEYSVRMKIEFDDNIYWLGPDSFSENYQFMGVHSETYDTYQYVNTQNLLDILMDCQL